MTANPAIALRGIRKQYRIYDRPEDRLKQMFLGSMRCYFREFEALRDVTLNVQRGETVGLVGRNGSGKSTLLQIVCGILTPSAGVMDIQGRISALLELGAGFNPEFSGRENIYLNGAILGLSRDEIDVRYEAIVAFSGLEDVHLNQPVKTYSSGMYVRLAFAIAVAVDPDILVVDEALAVGDEAFQRKCFARLREMQEQGATILFVSHSERMVMELCDRAILVDAGEVLMDAAPKPVLDQYQRLIYAAPERQPQIREAIMRGDWANSDDAQQQDAQAKTPVKRPETAMHYGSRGAEIINPRMETLDGAAVDVLHPGERYVYRYEVQFEKAAAEVRCGMQMKTPSGLPLGGSGTANEGETIAHVEAGSVVEVAFAFDCNLRAGNYYLNCGASAMEEGERVFLHRIIDALMFKVAEKTLTPQSGLVHFNIEPSTQVRASQKAEKQA